MKLITLTLTFLSLSLFISSCSKNNAGKGGNAQITVKVIDGNANVAGAEVKVMYNARTYPGATASYSETVTADNTGDAVFGNLRRGDYYFYSADTLREGGAFMNIASKFGETHVVIDFNEADPF